MQHTKLQVVSFYTSSSFYDSTPSAVKHSENNLCWLPYAGSPQQEFLLPARAMLWCQLVCYVGLRAYESFAPGITMFMADRTSTFQTQIKLVFWLTRKELVPTLFDTTWSGWNSTEIGIKTPSESHIDLATQTHARATRCPSQKVLYAYIRFRKRITLHIYR